MRGEHRSPHLADAPGYVFRSRVTHGRVLRRLGAVSPPNRSSADDPARWCSDAAFVRGLARQLLADEHGAEDLAQEAWLHALRGPAPRGGFRSWIAAIVRNLATSQHRRAQRRRRHETAAADGVARPAADASTVHASLEAHELLVTTVRALDEPYRTAIVRRYFDGLSPRAIAAERGLPVRTVHTHLQRGLDQLRARLRDRDPRWTALLLPVLPAPTTAAVLTMTTTTTKLAGFGALVAVVLCSLAWPMLTADAAPPTTSSAPPAVATATLGATGREPTLDRREATPAATAPAASTTAATAPREPWTVPGVVLALDGTPLAKLDVILTAFGEERPRARATSDTTGRFVLSLPEAAGGHLAVDDPAWTTAYRPVLWGQPERDELTVIAAPVTPVAGLTVDESGRPLAGVEVSLSAELPPRSTYARSLERALPGEWRTHSNADGSFALPRAPQLPGLQIRASATGYRSAHAAIPAPQRVHLVLQRAPILVGRVFDATGKPVEAAVFCYPAGAMSDAEGRFEIDLSHVASPWLVAAVQGQLPGRLECTNGPPTEPWSWPQPVELRLGGPPLSITGRAFAADGTPLASPQVTVLDAECLVPGNDMSSVEFLARVASRVTKDGAEFSDSGDFDLATGGSPAGAFALRGLQRRHYRLRLECPETCQWLDTEPIAAGTQDLALRLPAEPLWPNVAGVVVDRRGAPIARASVWMERVDPATQAVRNTPGLSTDADGRFAHGALACAAGTLCVQTEGIAHPTRIDLATHGDVAHLRLTAPVKTSARIAGALDADTGTFLDAQERPVAVTVTHGDSASGAFEVPLVEGASEVVTVPDDAVTLVLRKQGREVVRRRVELRPGELQVLRP